MHRPLKAGQIFKSKGGWTFVLTGHFEKGISSSFSSYICNHKHDKMESILLTTGYFVPLSEPFRIEGNKYVEVQPGETFYTGRSNILNDRLYEFIGYETDEEYRDRILKKLRGVLALHGNTPRHHPSRARLRQLRARQLF